MRHEQAVNAVNELSVGVLWLWCIAVTFAWWVLLAWVVAEVI